MTRLNANTSRRSQIATNVVFVQQWQDRDVPLPGTLQEPKLRRSRNLTQRRCRITGLPAPPDGYHLFRHPLQQLSDQASSTAGSARYMNTVATGIAA